MNLPAILDTTSYSAPCLETGPLQAKGRHAVTAARVLGASAWATSVRARGVPLVFDGMERVFAANQDPSVALLPVLDELVNLYAWSTPDDTVGVDRALEQVARDAGEVTKVTGEHYGRLFRGFSKTSFWDEPKELLETRLARNGIDPTCWKRKRVLDAGCGGGRYTVAWRKLGARHVTGIDVSQTGLADARRRVRDARISGVDFEAHSVLEMPFADDCFDVVFSNGVLHHTTNWRAGVSELVRVLRPHALGWLYLIESPGGFFWDLIELLRVIMQRDDRESVRDALARTGVPGNRIFYMLDHVMVPINVRLTPLEIENALHSAGATEIRRLTRGADLDRVEAIHRGDPYARQKYGVGENRYVFSKES